MRMLGNSPRINFALDKTWSVFWTMAWTKVLVKQVKTSVCPVIFKRTSAFVSSRRLIVLRMYLLTSCVCLQNRLNCSLPSEMYFPSSRQSTDKKHDTLRRDSSIDRREKRRNSDWPPSLPQTPKGCQWKVSSPSVCKEMHRSEQNGNTATERSSMETVVRRNRSPNWSDPVDHLLEPFWTTACNPLQWNLFDFAWLFQAFDTYLYRRTISLDVQHPERWFGTCTWKPSMLVILV